MNDDQRSPQKSPQSLEEWCPKCNPWLITVAVMLGAFMEVLDTSVANVSLPHIAGNLGVSYDESTWVLTSYLISNAIILPATGWLSRVFGRKRFLLSCIVIFTVSSLACGAAPSLSFLVLARVLQGTGGGALQPLAQAILLESFPPAKRGRAMAAFAVGVIFAPIIGPTLGGWITDNYSWRWIFYINGPVGVLTVLLVRAFVEDPPYLKSSRRVAIDYLGIGLLTLWLATMQIVLDKGQEDDWFAALWIRWFSAVSLISFIGFVYWELRVGEPLVNLRILANRNFRIGTLLITYIGAVLYAINVMLPSFLQQLLGYPALQSGLAVSPRGFGSLILLPFIGRLTDRLDNRLLLISGFILLAVSNFMFGHINLEINIWSVATPSVVSGMGLAFLFVPLTTLSMGTLPNDQIGNASGIYNLMRNLGGSVGISAVTTMIVRDAQFHQTILAAHASPFSHALAQQLKNLQHIFASQFDPVTAQRMAYDHIYGTLQNQAALWAYIDNFRFFGYLCLLCIPLVLAFKRVRPAKGQVARH